jgi:two-component system sensor histidine kinase DctS
MLSAMPKAPSATLPSELPFDFALLQQSQGKQSGRNRWTLLWLLGLLLLTVGAVVMLVLYLNNFEREEQERVGRADALVLEQATQFHFRRLEDDLLVLAHQQVARTPEPAVQGGHLWRQPGVVLAHGWIAADTPPTSHAWPKRWRADYAAHPDNAERMDSMREISRGLRRAAYAGPMREGDGTLLPVVWLAVPLYERGQFAGNYLAALSMDVVASALAPDWFESQQTVHFKSDDLDSALPRLAAMSLAGTDLYLEASPRLAQAATVPRIFFVVALLFLLGMLISLFALRRDMLKRQQIQALLQAEVALRSAMENSVTIGLRAWDLHGKILYVNEAFCRMVGYPARELVGKSAPLPYWPSAQADELHLVHRDIIAQGTQGDGVDVQFQHRTGTLIDVLIHEAPLTTAGGEHIGWMSSVMDVSERKRAQRMAALQQDKLEASGRLVAVGEVASTLAHELNQPLGALSSFANGLLNRLQRGNITLEAMTPVIERMVGLAQRSGRIIQRVNAFARQREISLQRLDLMPVLQRVLSNAALLQGRNLALVDSVPSIWLDADELLLEHLINNLAGNALDWAASGAAHAQVRVTVASDMQQGMAVITVADSGPGVADEDRANIFNAFFSTKDGGMGMGLAICRSIVEAHRGRIEVGRDPELGGARFTVWLPLGGP